MTIPAPSSTHPSASPARANEHPHPHPIEHPSARPSVPRASAASSRASVAERFASLRSRALAHSAALHACVGFRCGASGDQGDARLAASSPALVSLSPARAEGLHVRQTHRAPAQRALSSRAHFLQLLFLAALGLMLAALCAGCSAANGTAAVVNGTSIPEQTVTDYVQSLRAAQGLEGSAEWKAYLEDSGQTSEGIRDQVVDLLISREILRQGADDLGIRVNNEEIDDAVNAKRRTYESDEQWKQALEAAGLDEQTYRDEVELDLLSGKVTQALADSPELTAKATQDTDDSAYDEVGDSASADSVVPDEATVEAARTQAALTWLANLRAEADIAINPIPSGLPY